MEHSSAKDLIKQIIQSAPGDPLYDAKVTVLGEYIEHHVKEEEDETFPKVRKSGLDVQALGEERAAGKDDRLAEMVGAE